MTHSSKKVIKLIALLVVTAILLITIAAVVVVATIDQNTLKDKATQFVSNKTGRELKIAGDVTWSFFPWLGIKIQNVSLSNPASFNQNQFAKAETVGVSIRLLPLILGKIEADHLILKNFDLQLIENSSGVGNWQDLSSLSHATNRANVTRKSNFDHSTKFIINSIEIDNGNIVYENQQTNKKIKITKLNLSGKNIELNRPFEMQISFDVAHPGSILSNGVNANLRIKVDAANGIYLLKNLRLQGKLKNNNGPRFADFTAAATVVIDLKKQTLLTEDFKLHLADAIATVALRGTKIIDDPDFLGKLTLKSSNPKTLIHFLGSNKYSKSWSDASLQFDFAASPKFIKFSSIAAKLGDSILQGDATFAMNEQLAFNLVLNKIDFATLLDFDGGLPPSTKNKTQVKTEGSSNSLKSASSTKLFGNFKVGAIQFEKLHLSDFVVKITGNDKFITCQNIGFNFYRGQASGTANIDLRDVIPRSNLKLTLTNVFLQELLLDLANYSKFNGKLDLSANVKMSGTALNSLSGDGSGLITQGSYQGLDIPFEVKRVHAVLNGKPLPQKTQPPHTDFDRLTMRFKINNGLLTTEDLFIQAPDYKVTGQGNANLISKNLNLALSAYSTHDASFFVPIKISGAFTDPVIKLDMAMMLQHQVNKAVKDAIGKQIENGLQQINLPQNLKNILPF